MFKKKIKIIMASLLTISAISLTACSSQIKDHVVVNNTDNIEEKKDLEKIENINENEKQDSNEEKTDKVKVEDKKEESKEEKKDNQKEETKNDANKNNKVNSSSSNSNNKNNSTTNNKNNSTTNSNNNKNNNTNKNNNSSSNTNKNNNSNNSSNNNSSNNSSTSKKESIGVTYINGLKFVNWGDVKKQSWCTNWKCESIFHEKYPEYKDYYLFDDSKGFIIVDQDVTNPVYWETKIKIEEDYLFREINNYRVANGRKPLEHFDGLKNWANVRAEELTTNFSHDTKYEEADFVGTSCGGENIGYGADPDVILQAWKDSPGHNRALLDEDYGYMEVSVRYKGNVPYYVYTPIHADYKNMSCGSPYS